MTLEELFDHNFDCYADVDEEPIEGIPAMTKETFISIIQQEIDKMNDKIADIKNKQRELAGFMANDMQIIAMRYNTVVSTEAINMEFRKVFDKYFPSPKESE